MSEPALEYHPWSTYVVAREVARARGDRRVGTEHLAVALLEEPEVAEALELDSAHACRALIELDRQALRGLGIETPGEPEQERGGVIPDRSSIPARPSIRQVLTRRLPMTPVAKAVLRDSTKDMRRPGRPPPVPGAVMSALLELRPPDPAAELLGALGVDAQDAHERLRQAR